MTWLFILLDVLIFLALVVLCGLTVCFWNKKGGLKHDSLENFRNEEIYERSKEEQKRMAHIEDIMDEEEEFIEPPIETEAVAEEEIVFAAGYGGMTELGVEDDD